MLNRASRVTGTFFLLPVCNDDNKKTIRLKTDGYLSLILCDPVPVLFPIHNDICII